MEGNDREELDLKTQAAAGKRCSRTSPAAVNAQGQIRRLFSLVIDKGPRESFNKLHTPIVLYSNGEK